MTPHDIAWTVAAAGLLPVAVLLALPLLSDLWSLGVVGWRATTRPIAPAPAIPRQRLLVLVAAHDEEALIGDAVRSMVAMSRKDCDFDLRVIADNCNDRTAEVASEAGAIVLERRDATRRGKPWALDWAMRRLPVSDYDGVVIVDADTVVDADFADALARRGPLRDKAVQSYSAISNELDSWLTQLGALLVSMRYDGQYALKRAAGLNCPLGNGWCMGTDLLARAGWAPDSLTETWELYARYTVLGAQVDFASDAVMRGQEAHTLSQGATQRKRWQAGKRSVFRRYWKRALTERGIGARQRLDLLGELAAPGPVLHATLAIPIGAALWLSEVWLARATSVVLALSLVPTFAWTSFAWWRQPHRARLIAAMAHVPLYAVWRVAVAGQAFGTARRGHWQRSPRHSSPTPTRSRS